MTDNEIIKALECCVNNQYCWLCVLKDREDDCYNILKSAFDLINRQKAEIETSRTETIKEFAEKFKSTLENLEANSPNKTYQTAMQDMLDYYVPKIIDDLVKEMTEGENG